MVFGAHPRGGGSTLLRTSLLILAFCGIGFFSNGASAQAMTLPYGFGESTLAEGSGAPTAVAWAPDGRLFIAHKDGLVQVRASNGNVATLLDLSAKVNSYTDRGLLGIAVDKDFASNGYLYLLYVRELNTQNPDSDSPMTSRLTRVTVNANNTLQNPSDPETVILGTQTATPCPQPNNVLDCIPADFYWHTVGAVRSDPVDGTLWVGIGDAHVPVADPLSYRTYDPASFAGKIIHIDRAGRGLANHPFCPADTDLTHVCTKIYATGFRNPFRFTLRPGAGPAVGDVGEDAYEELNLVQPGGNYGWPCYEGEFRNVGWETEPRCQEEYAREGTAAAALPPAWSFAHTPGGDAIVLGPYYGGSNYPAEYAGRLFVGNYAKGWIKTLTIGSSGQVTAVNPFATETGPIVDMEPGPSGDLMYVDIGFGSTPAVRRITHAGGNLAPRPVASATPDHGNAPLTVQFNGSGSSDPEGNAITYDWDFGDGSAHSTLANPQHTYGAVGIYTARLTVDDGFNRFPSTTVTITVGGNAAPVAAITAPAAGDLYRDGTTVQLAGSASDREDGTLGNAGLSWRILLHHGSHLHEVATPSGATASFTPLIDHDADSHYEIVLTARDSGGATDTERVEIYPETAALRFESTPPGARMIYSGTSFTAPGSRSSAVGYRATIEAPASFTYGGHNYLFEGWSDAGARRHEIAVPVSDTTYTARYRREFAPGTTITAGPSGLTRNAQPQFSFTSDDPVAVFQCSFDGAAFAACTSPAAPGPLEDGTHVFRVRAADPYVGTADPTPASREFSVDATAPAPVHFDFSRPRSPSRQRAPLIFGSAEPGSEVWVYDNPDCRGDALTGGPAADFASVGLRLIVEENTVSHLRAIALDTAGNRSPCSQDPFVFIEDSREPEIWIRSGPGGKVGDRSPTFVFRASEAVSRFRCRRDRHEWRRCRSPYTLAELGAGRHVFRVTGFDLAGNRGTVARRVFSVTARHRRRAEISTRAWPVLRVLG